MSDRKIPRKIEKLLFQEANSQCLACGKDDISVLMVHHIIPYSDKPQHDPAHMLVLCANCHAKADRGEISRGTLYGLKKQGKSNIIQFPKTKSPKDNISVTGDGNVTAGGDINIGGNLNIRMPKGSRNSPIIIPGTVAEDKRMIGYLKYLAVRYNDFKKWECEKKGLSPTYSLIYVAYKREMKYSIKDTPREVFSRGVDYLQRRIRNTMLGRNLKKRGQELYASFERFDQKNGTGGTPNE